jgi:hypothetical protein
VDLSAITRPGFMPGGASDPLSRIPGTLATIGLRRCFARATTRSIPILRLTPAAPAS